jgi:hypothetical protein
MVVAGLLTGIQNDATVLDYEIIAEQANGHYKVDGMYDSSKVSNSFFFFRAKQGSEFCANSMGIDFMYSNFPKKSCLCKARFFLKEFTPPLHPHQPWAPGENAIPRSG